MLDPNGKMSCIVHSKEVQAFCFDELRLLCIECLIQEKDRHKEHQVMTLSDAVSLERLKMQEKAEEAY